MKNKLIALTLMAASIAFPAAKTESALQVAFPFKAGNVQFPAGSYRVRLEPIPSGRYVLVFRNADGNQQIVLPSGRIRNTMPTAAGIGFVFTCETEDNCQLREIHSGGGPAFEIQP
ncbi:MAG: hypothetical protein JST93_30920 [Acidobacteria bacterium]|nr:hypothetical protein [Acidobacteriota bacterium]